MSSPGIDGHLKYISRALGGANVLYYHSGKELTWDDVQQFKDAVREFDSQRELAFVLNTVGGDADAAIDLIAHMQGRFKRVTAVVPFVAASAGTLIALSCSGLIISRTAKLTSTDPIAYPRVQMKEVMLAHTGHAGKRKVSAERFVAGLHAEFKSDYEKYRKCQAEFLKRAGRSDAEVEELLAFFYDDADKKHDDPIYHKHIKHLPLKMGLLEDSQKLPGLNESVHGATDAVIEFAAANPKSSQAFFLFKAG